jgi:hypothetical protein
LNAIYNFETVYASVSFHTETKEVGFMKRIAFIISTLALFTTVAMMNPSIAQADVQVYDNNNQYLGVMVYMDDDYIDIFIPSLGGTFKYSIDYSGWCGDEFTVVFETNDCSLTKYAEGPFPIIYDGGIISTTGFYKVDYSGAQTFTPGSYYDWNCECQQNTGEYPSAVYYPLVQVQMPFATPVALPLRFEVRTRAVVIPMN